MNPIQSILVHLDGTQRAATRLALAHELAGIHQASLSAVFAVSPRWVPLSPATGAPAVPLVEEIDLQHRDRARALFESAIGQGAASSTWHEATGGLPIPEFVEHALLADLLVLGQRDPDDQSGLDVPAGFVEAAIIDSGRPAFVVPCRGETTAAPQTVLVAWKRTREAARAVTAALPFLRRANSVHLACAGENIVETRRTLKQLRHYLTLHRVAPRGEDHALADGDAGAAILSTAAGVRADLLVMGCYGHSRSRELALGGVSRSVLRSMSLPVLMAH